MRGTLVTTAIACTCAALSATPASAQTRADYAAQVNPICAEASDEAERIIKKTNFKNPKLTSKGLRRLDRLSERTIDALEAVPPPPADVALAGAWIQSLRQLNELGDRAARATVSLLRQFRRPSPSGGRVRALVRRLKQLRRRSNDEVSEGSAHATQLGATGCTGGDAPALQP